MKLYQLTVHRTPEEEEAEAAEAALEFPRVDHMEHYRGKMSPPSLDPSEEGDEQDGSRMGAPSWESPTLRLLLSSFQSITLCYSSWRKFSNISIKICGSEPLLLLVLWFSLAASSL